MILLNINSHAKESTKLVLQDLLSIKAPATVCLIEDSPCCLTGLRKPVTHTGLTRPTPGESLSLPLVWPGLLREKICHSHRFDPAYSWRKPVTSTGLTRPTPGESLSLTLVWSGLLREKACQSHWGHILIQVLQTSVFWSRPTGGLSNPLFVEDEHRMWLIIKDNIDLELGKLRLIPGFRCQRASWALGSLSYCY